MKASASLLFLFLVVAGCTDTINGPSGLTAPTSTPGALRSNPPPPPADAIVSVCSPGGCVVLDGTYFSNGADVATIAAITQSLEEECAFPEATSWLKFSNRLSEEDLGGTASPNAQIRCSQGKAAGKGKITYELGGEQIVLEFKEVLFFTNSPECSPTAPYCANFTATVTINGVLQTAPAIGNAYNREFYDEFCSVDGDFVYCYNPEVID